MSEDMNIDFENIKNASSKNILANFDWIEKALKILLRDKKYENNLYQECNLLIDIFCINEMASFPCQYMSKVNMILMKIYMIILL